MSKGPSQSPPTAAELERQKWLHEQNQRAAERAHDTSKEVALQVNEAAISAGNLALRMSLLINGGAAAALLTFVGGLPANQKRAVADTLVWFASDVLELDGDYSVSDLETPLLEPTRPSRTAQREQVTADRR
jgi:hypothetical protein